jgi:hypothetical protein
VNESINRFLCLGTEAMTEKLMPYTLEVQVLLFIELA